MEVDVAEADLEKGGSKPVITFTPAVMNKVTAVKFVGGIEIFNALIERKYLTPIIDRSHCKRYSTRAMELAVQRLDGAGGLG